MKDIPFHLQKYIVEQNETQYSFIDHAVWRYILRQLKAYLKIHAHPSYIEGLEKTGIETERIPQIAEISKKIEKFGWRAVPVSGFLPPAVFMELQSLKILPIASDMRTIEHLTYTPAPDIVHEAAGHAPLLANAEYTQYLTEYAMVAKKAIMSSEDLKIYEAIRKLSDSKERPTATQEEKDQAQTELEKATAQISFVSEAAQLARMNWWTAEYGLIGDLQKPKIFGAGLLSSVGEAKECLSPKVRKIPLTVKCIEQGYDITEPQPQLFVTPSFSHLSKVLQEMSAQMAYKTGGASGLKKAELSKTVNTIELASGLQISGVLEKFMTDKDGSVSFVKTAGPTQLAHENQELPGHSTQYHSHGFSSPIGLWKGSLGRCPSQLDEAQLASLGLQAGKTCRLEFENGFKVEGLLKAFVRSESRLLLLQWDQVTVTLGPAVYYQPGWGPFDMAVGASVPSVFGGPADSSSFGNREEFVAARVPAKPDSEKKPELDLIYKTLRDLREQSRATPEIQKSLTKTANLLEKYAEDWLASIEALEILSAQGGMDPGLVTKFMAHLKRVAQTKPELKASIQDGLALIQNPKISLDAPLMA